MNVTDPTETLVTIEKLTRCCVNCGKLNFLNFISSKAEIYEDKP